MTDDRFGHKMSVMTQPPTIIEILRRWPSRRAVHEDAKVIDPALELIAVHRWFQRESVPPRFDAALLQGADRRGFGLHPMELVNARSTHIDRVGHAQASRQVQRSNRGAA
ncbi:hypothetical protein [Paracoccus sp. PAR01]|uniref:hypothetical protein n=1 Tax=Paracoccus sp. PAR01 TaxID=2769282 RepID=UPI001785AC0E|nr:hypothetical protein [Paracoccus sp. PAR01]MBD9529002.1 hypothetical protein [Paracoccus sp. PAR01]